MKKIYFISIPSGAIKSAPTMERITKMVKFQFLLVRLKGVFNVGFLL